MAWSPNALLIRTLRERGGWTIAAMAKKVGVRPRTIERIESGRQRYIRESTLGAIAQIFGGELEDYATFHPMMERSGSRPASKVALPWPVQRRQPGEPTNPFSLRLLRDIRTAFRIHQGRLVVMTGRLQAQAALSTVEGVALGCASGVGARFKVVTGRGRGACELMVYAVALPITRVLQAHAASGKPIKMIARVVVVEGCTEHPTLQDERRLPRDVFTANWRGFAIDDAGGKAFWALVIVGRARG